MNSITSVHSSDDIRVAPMFTHHHETNTTQLWLLGDKVALEMLDFPADWGHSGEVNDPATVPGPLCLLINHRNFEMPLRRWLKLQGIEVYDPLPKLSEYLLAPAPPPPTFDSQNLSDLPPHNSEHRRTHVEFLSAYLATVVHGLFKEKSFQGELFCGEQGEASRDHGYALTDNPYDAETLEKQAWAHGWQLSDSKWKTN